jgi:hypothetical protein
MGQFKQLKRSLAKRGAMVGRTVVEAPIRYTSEQQITNVQTGQSFPVTVHYGPNALPPRNLVKIGWKDEGDEGPIVGFFSDGSKGRMGDLESAGTFDGKPIQDYPWYSRKQAEQFAKQLGVPLEEL